MNKENAYQEARQKHCLRVSTVRKMSFYRFFKVEKECLSKNNRILSFSGQFTLPEHDLSFMNREKLTIEKF